MSITDALSAKRSELIDLLVQTNTAGGSAHEARQLVNGYYNLLAAAAAGDLAPRDEFLSTVIPALRAAGMPLSVVMDGLVRLAAATGAVLGTEHAPWLCQFLTEYCERILATWGSPSLPARGEQ